MFERLQSKHDLCGCSVSTSPRALRVAATECLVNLFDERIVVQRRIDESEDWIHQVLRLAKRRSQNDLSQRELGVAAPDHPKF
jgi:hypothetical protein